MTEAVNYLLPSNKDSKGWLEEDREFMEEAREKGIKFMVQIKPKSFRFTPWN